MKNVALICVTHDPNDKNLELFRRVKDRFNEIYTDLYITVSEETNNRLCDELLNSGFKVKKIPKKGAAQARREVVKFGLGGSNEYYHYCDFDRILTWIEKYPNELSSIVKEISKWDYTILGRTERAFNTHPIEWIQTEKVTNKIFSLELGQEADVTAGSCSFSRISGEYINTYSKDKMTDAEWPMIIHRIARLKIGYKAVEGLEYDEDTNGNSRKISESEKWFSRVRLCYIISESAMKTGKEKI